MISATGMTVGQWIVAGVVLVAIVAANWEIYRKPEIVAALPQQRANAQKVRRKARI